MTPSSPIRASRAGLALFCAGGLALGCAGRSEFRRGSDLLARGDYRQAYYQFWEAHNQNPCPEYLTALKDAGRRTARIEEARGIDSEADCDLEAAIESFALALEYDPFSLEIIECYSRAWSAAQSPARSTEVIIRESLGNLESSRIAALRTATLDQPLSEDPERLLVLQQEWQRVQEDLEALLELEEDAHFAPDPPLCEGVDEDAGETRKELYRARCEAEQASSVLDRALDGSRKFAEGRAAEARGDLDAALAAYLAATFAHPTHESACAARARVLRRVKEEAYQRAVYKARDRDWRGALTEIDRLLSVEPDHAEGLELRRSFRRELEQRQKLDARRFEDAGLPGCALVRYYLALEADVTSTEVRAAVARIEASILLRLHPRVRIELGDPGPDVRRARRDLWDVAEDAAARFEEGVLQAAREAARSTPDSRPGESSGSTAPELLLRIEDLDFRFSTSGASHGTEVSRYLESFPWVPNGEIEVAARAVEARKRSLAMALEVEAAAPITRRSLASGLAQLEGLRLAQATTLLAGLARESPRLEWRSTSYSTVDVVTTAEAAGRYRLGTESRSVASDQWVMARIELRARFVEGDLLRNVPPDPGKGLTRQEALRRLAPRLGQALLADAERKLEAVEEQYYNEGIRRLEAHAFDIATENLVVFLYSRRGKDDPLAREAARRLRDLTGCDLPGSWALVSPGAFRSR